MSMEIKTISYNLDEAEAFDKEVNTALADGWHLADRKLAQTPAGYKDYLYAELVKLPKVEAEPVTWQEAMQVLRKECDSHASCMDCPATDACNHYPPNGWELGLLEESHD